MSIRARVRTLFCCLTLEIAALTGIPMRPEQVQELMQTMNQPKMSRTTPDDSDSGRDNGDGDGADDPP